MKAKGNTAGGNNADFFCFINFLKRNIIFVIVPMIIVNGLLGVYLFLYAQPVYEATAQLYMVTSSNVFADFSSLLVGTYLTSDYQELFYTWEVSQQVINQLHLPYSVKEMQDRLTIKNPSNTRILQITFFSTDAQEAADIANAYASVASEYIAAKIQVKKPTILSNASKPLQPSRPRKALMFEFGTLVVGSITLWCLYIVFLMNDKRIMADHSNSKRVRIR